MFFKNFRTFKNSPFEKVRFFKITSFDTKFRVFKNSPFEKVCTFQKVAFFNKIRFVDINIWVSPTLYGTFVILYPSTSKNLQKTSV